MKKNTESHNKNVSALGFQQAEGKKLEMRVVNSDMAHNALAWKVVSRSCLVFLGLNLKKFTKQVARLHVFAG